MNSDRDADRKLPAGQAFARYWRRLVGLALLPSVAEVAMKGFGIQPDAGFDLAFALLFFVAIAPAVWLLMTDRVSYSFWFVTIGVAFVAACLASLVPSLFELLGK